MALYNISNDILSRVKSKPFSLEKDIQKLTEKNLETLFDLEFISSEFAVREFRIDSLAFDREANAFVIVEYKKDKNFSVIDQGYAYLSIMLNNKADFILEYNEKSSTALKKKDVDWSQSRVLFIAPSFTLYQKASINFKGLPMELWEIKCYSNDLILYNRIASEGAVENIKIVSKNEKKITAVSKEIKVYTEDDVIKVASENIRAAYFKIKEEINQLDVSIDKKITKTMICFYSDGKGLVWVNPKKKKIKLYLRKGEYLDKYEKIKPEGWGGYPELTLLEDDMDVAYLKDLFQQAIKN